jgi:tRNA A-37 threonylcarbamoyl transferase component Bud32
MDETALLGTTIADTYLIEELLGAGGMGTVYVARNVRLGKRYALKVLNPEVASAYPDAVERFQREAVTASRLGHVGIVQVHDIAQTEDQIFYMVMDLLAGEDLEGRMVERGLLPWEQIYPIIVQTCDALATAHEAGIIHRDLKPANIFLARRRGEGERAVLLDFGVAKVLDAQRNMNGSDSPGTDGGSGPSPTLTKPGTVLGTPNYMAPEQAAGRGVDHRSDIYAMGAVLFHMATGRPPFEGESLLAVLTMIALDPVPPIHTVAPEAQRPTQLDEVIRWAMAKNPDDRFQDIRQFANAVPPPNEASRVVLLASTRMPAMTPSAGLPALGQGDTLTPCEGQPALGRGDTMAMFGNAAPGRAQPGGAVRPPRNGGTTPGNNGAGAEAWTAPAPEVAPLMDTMSQPLKAVALPEAAPKKAAPRRWSIAIVGAIVLAGIVVGVIAALSGGQDAGTSSTPTKNGPTEPATPTSHEALLGQAVAEIQREIEAERWTTAAGLLANYSRQFPQQQALLTQLGQRVELEMESAALHRRALAQHSQDQGAARQLCDQIENNSVYRLRAPCPELLAPPPADGSSPPTAEDRQPPQADRQARRRPLSDREVQRVIRRRRPSAMRCFDRAFEGGYRPVGTVRVAVRVRIADTGRVTEARLLDSRHPTTAAFRVCLENRVRGWEFPSAGAATTTEIPFVFRAAELDLESLD